MNTYIKNEKGFSLIELLIVVAISSLLLTATITVFVKQDKLLKKENANTNLRAIARNTIDQMVRDLRRAGNGFPPNQGVLAASATSVRYGSNTAGVMSVTKANAAAGAVKFNVADSTGFNVGDGFVIFDAENTGLMDYYPYTAGITSKTGTGGTTLNFAAGLGNTYTYDDGVETHAIAVNQIKEITYAYDATNDLITRSINGGTAVTVAQMVTAFSFVYYDDSDADLTATPTLTDITVIQIVMTLQDSIVDDANITVQAEANVRNL